MLSFVICIRGCCVGGGGNGAMVVLVLSLRWFWYALCSDDGWMDGWMDGRLHSSPVEKTKKCRQKSNKKTKCNILCVYVNANAVVMSSSLSALMQLD